MKVYRDGAKVVIEMSEEEARDLDAGMADLLCWCRGFAAAYTGDNGPMGVDELREIRSEIAGLLYPGREIPF